MTKKTIFIFSLLTLSVCEVYSQTINDFLRALPNEYFNNLTIEDREKLLVENKFYPSGNDEHSIQVYRIEESTNDASDYMKVTMSFETGQRGFNSFELKRWTLNTGGYLFGISRAAGTPVEFIQADVSFFTLNDYILNKINTNIPSDLSLHDFAKQNTPDQLLQEYSQYISLSITFEKEGNDIFWRIHENMGGNDFDVRWLKGNAIRYTWNGKEFIKSEYIHYP